MCRGARVLCREVFVGAADMMSDESLENVVVASYLGGMAAGNPGVVHQVSAGLWVVLHMPHGKTNCYGLSVLGDVYPEEHKEFQEMLSRNGISLPKGLCANLAPAQYQALYEGSIIHEKPLTNALGPEFKSILSEERLTAMFRQM